jgi:hypothetical protein
MPETQVVFQQKRVLKQVLLKTRQLIQGFGRYAHRNDLRAIFQPEVVVPLAFEIPLGMEGAVPSVWESGPRFSTEVTDRTLSLSICCDKRTRDQFPVQLYIARRLGVQ